MWQIRKEGLRVRNAMTDEVLVFPRESDAEKYARLSYGPFPERGGRLTMRATHYTIERIRK